MRVETPEVSQVDPRDEDKGVDDSFQIKTSTIMRPGLVMGKCEDMYELLHRIIDKNASAFYGDIESGRGVVHIPAD